MQVAERELVVMLDQGLHARPAARFVETAARFQSEITVIAGSRSASAKSILGVLSLGVRKGTVIRIRAEGDDAGAAVEALSQLVSQTHVD
ncbi:MAG TPA: HPr family phosphocarrier protein [Symbiobacteriaceae bacterium]